MSDAPFGQLPMRVSWLSLQHCMQVCKSPPMNCPHDVETASAQSPEGLGDGVGAGLGVGVGTGLGVGDGDGPATGQSVSCRL